MMKRGVEVEAREGQIYHPQPMLLEGIRIVDLTMVGAGPWATRLLGDLGAEVLKIEEPAKGDSFRATFTRPRPEVPPEVRARWPSPLFEDFNSNKKGVTLDLHLEKGQDILHQLVAKSDVFATNLLPAALQRFKADYDTLVRYNSKLIYAIGSAHGVKGPDANRPGNAGTGAARSGLMAECGHPGVVPQYPPYGATDMLHAQVMAFGIVSALLARERLGVGQQVSLSQVGATMNILCRCSLAEQLLWGTHTEGSYPHAQSPRPYGTWYKCKDGKYLMLSGTFRPQYWLTLCTTLGRPELAKDPRFVDDQKQAENSAELIKILDELFLTKTAKEWDDIFRQTGEYPCAVVNELADLPNDPMVIANNNIWELDHPTGGKGKFPGYPFTLSKTPATFRTRAPELGEHTEEVLTGLLGYTWDEVLQLREEKVF